MCPHLLMHGATAALTSLYATPPHLQLHYTQRCRNSSFLLRSVAAAPPFFYTASPQLLLPYAQHRHNSFLMLPRRHSVRRRHCRCLFLRFFGYFCYLLPLRDGKSGRHGPPLKICIATALLWQWLENPPWPIIDNIGGLIATP